MPALMTKIMHLLWRPLVGTPLATLLVVTMLATPASAAGTYSWTGGGGNTSWGTATNWASGTAPPASSVSNTLSFSGTTVTSNTNNIASLSLSNLNFLTGASAFTLSGSDITLSSGTISNASSNLQTINLGITLAGSNTISLAGAGRPLTIAGLIAGSGSITKTGVSVLTLSGSNNTYSGLTTVSAGTLAYGASDVIGSGGLTVNGGTIAMGNYSDTVGAVTVGVASAAGTITGGSGVLTATSYSFQNGAVSAALAGSGTLSKTTANTVTLTGSNSFSGDLSITAGVLNIQNSNALGSTSGSTTINGGSLQLQNDITLAGEKIVFQGGAGYGAIRNISGTNTISGSLSMAAASSRINSDAGLLRITGTTALSGATGPLLVGGAGDTLISSVVAITSGGLTKDGAGALTLSGSNTYTGQTTVSEGKLTYGTDNALATGAVVVGSATTSGVLNLGTYSDSVGRFTLTSGTLAMAANATSQAQLVSTGSILLGTTNTLDLAGSGTSAGLYKLLAGTAVTGTFGTVSNMSNAYSLLQTGSTLDLQQKAVIGTITATPAAAAIITGGSTAFNYTVANGNATGGATLAFSGTAGSNVTGSVTSGSAASASTSGSIGGLTFTGATTGSNQAGTFTVNAPNAYGTTATGTVNVNVYAHSSPTLTSGTINVGNVHVGYGNTTSLVGLSATNAAGYRVDMSGSAPASGNVSLSSLSAVAAGTSATINATLAAGGTAGAVSQNLIYTFRDDSSLSGASSNTGTAAITVVGGIYNLAAANPITTPVTLTNIHVGGTFGTTNLTISNTAPAGSYTEGLNAGFGTGIGSVSTNSGTFSNLAAGSTNNSSLTVGLGGSSNSGAAGVVTGTQAILLVSNGTISGLANTSLATQNVAVSGTVFNLAAANTITTPITLTNIRVGGTFGTSALTISNTAPAGNYTEGLNAAFGSGTGSVSTNSGTFSNLAAGQTNSSSLVVGLGGSSNTSLAGLVSGTQAVSLVSNGTNSGLANTNLTTQNVAISGGVYNYANAAYTGTTVAFGNVHQGASGVSQNVAFGNQTVTNASYQDLLNVSGTTTNAQVTANGFTGLAASTGGSTTNNLGLTANTATLGSLASTVNLTLVSNANGVSGLSNGVATVVGSPTAITTTGNVYSGQSTWAANGSGSWGTLNNSFGTNWGANQGSPGLDAGFTNTDTATFGSATASGTAVVSLNGASPSLRGITFNNAAATYNIAQGSSGSLTLSGSGGAATVDVLAGSQIISAPLILSSSASMNVASIASLTVQGGISGTGGLEKRGTGVLTLAGVNTYTGPTDVFAGELKANGTTAIGSAVTIASGATLSGTGTIGGNTTISGTHTPGNVLGVQTFTGDLTYSGISAGPSVYWQLAGNTTSNSPLAYNQVAVGGNLRFDAATTLNLAFGSANSTVDWNNSFWSSWQNWTLYNVGGTTTNSANFLLSGTDWLDAGSQLLSSVRSGYTFQVSQIGNNIVISYVPEPSTYAMAIVALGMGGVRAWRKRKAAAAARAA